MAKLRTLPESMVQGQPLGWKVPNSLTCSGMSGRGAVPKGHNAKDCHTSACLTPREACQLIALAGSPW